MSSYQDRVLARYATEAVLVTAVLRLPLIALIALLGTVVDVDHWEPVVFRIILALYAVTATVWLFEAVRRPAGRWAGWASTTVDLVMVIALCAASGGATSYLLPVFFLLPVAVAFQYRPALTAALGTSTAAAYFLVYLFYAVRDDHVDLPNVVYLYLGFLLWLTVATTGLSFVLVRRARTVVSLLDVRRQLVTEALGAEENERQRLAEELHDGPLQNVLAARFDVEEARETSDDPALAAAEAALRETAIQLRSSVTSLHPQVLAQLGLSAAVRELVDKMAARAGYEVRAQIEDVGHPSCQSLIYKVARELLVNIDKHADASHVSITLRQTDSSIELTVQDDGIGFDTAVLSKRVGEGHIGLASHYLRVESLGGTFDLTSEPGDGTRVRIALPLD
ncbi:sensor histidine kinase [Rhodococcoides yunnanense]|uniref:sensor histidine kinase n=1 Tax=Rhodococcoides yunnanense TaxID=278209 RepID=UPI000933212A|nr:ATP-binding protein [Rhodococcus yunnanensis]